MDSRSQKQSPKAEDSLRQITASLNEAIDDCIDAALEEFSQSLQQKLLKVGCILQSRNLNSIHRPLRLENLAIKGTPRMHLLALASRCGCSTL